MGRKKERVHISGTTVLYAASNFPTVSHKPMTIYKHLRKDFCTRNIF